MIDSKLLIVLRTLNKEEFRAFGKFLHSPYFNSTVRIRNLYDYLVPCFPFFKNRKLKREKIWEKLFPEKAFNHTKLNDLFSDTTVLLLRFFAVENFTKDKCKVRQESIDQLKTKGHHAYFVRESLQQEKELLDSEKQTALPPEKTFRLSQAYQELYFNPHVDKYTPEQPLLTQAAYRLRESYLTNYLQLACESISRSRIMKTTSEVTVEDHLLQQCTRYPKQSMVSIYLQLYHTLNSSDIHFFDTAWPLLKDQMNRIPKAHEWTILQSLINHVGFLYHQGNPELAGRLLLLFKQGLEKAIFIENGQLRGSTFLNIVITAAVVKDFDYLEHLQNQYEHLLPDTERKNTIPLAKAYILFHQKAYKKALSQLQQLDGFKELYYKLRVKCLEIRCFYEEGMRDSTFLDIAFARLDAFAQYLWRNQAISGSKAEAYKNFISITKKLVVHHQQKEIASKKLSALLKKVQTTQPLMVKPWLEKKVREAMLPGSGDQLSAKKASPQ